MGVASRRCTPARVLISLRAEPNTQRRPAHTSERMNISRMNISPMNISRMNISPMNISRMNISPMNISRMNISPINISQ